MATRRYRPLLRSKSGEATALRNLSASAKSCMSPIMHLVQRPPATFSEEIGQSWTGLPLALDGTFHVDVVGSTTQYTHTFDRLGKSGVQIIPSVELDATDPYRSVVHKRVGWVERSDTHQLHFMEPMGFAQLNPSYLVSLRKDS